MASVKDLKSISSASTLLDETKKHKKKKAKKSKKEKRDKPKSEAKGQQSSKDFTDISDLNSFAEWVKIRRKEKTRRKKKPDSGLNEAFPLMQNKNFKLSRQHKQNRKPDCAPGEHGACSGAGNQEALQPITGATEKGKKQKKRVVFNLSPLLLEPPPVQVAKHGLQLHRFGAEKTPPFDAVLPSDGRHGKPGAEEKNGTESQSTSDDINSQDLFITQKTFSEPYIDLCSSTSAEEAGEPQGYTEPSAKGKASPGHQAYAESSPWKPSCPKHQASTASSAKKRSSPERGCSTASDPKLQSHTVSSRKQFCPEPQASTASSPWKLPSPKFQCYTACCPKPQSFLNKATHPSRQSSPCHKLDAFTQTENFFSSSLLTPSFRFRQRSPCTEEPMDLSLRKRSASKAPGDQHYTSQPKLTDPTPSDDSDSHSKSKADLSQLKTVQTRLNESFFFKLKGEADSPKPASPLTKFTGSAEKKL